MVGNYLLPGSGLVTGKLVSEGAQDILSSDLGKLAMIGSGLSGAGLVPGVSSAAEQGYGWSNLGSGWGGTSLEGTPLGMGPPAAEQMAEFGGEAFSQGMPGYASFVGPPTAEQMAEQGGAAFSVGAQESIRTSLALHRQK